MGSRKKISKLCLAEAWLLSRQGTNYREAGPLKASVGEARSQTPYCLLGTFTGKETDLNCPEWVATCVRDLFVYFLTDFS